MSQKRNTVNFVIHDANGKPQMVKVIQNTPNHIAPVKQSNIKIVKLPATSGSVDAVQGGSSGVQVLQSVKIGGVKCASKVVPLPADTLAQLKKEPESEQVQLNQVQQTLLQLKQEAREDPEFEELIIEVPPLQPKPSRERKGLRVMSYTSRRRHNSDNDPPPEYTTKRRKHADKVGKGLRHFSMKVCEKVRTKGSTSYNEVADELVAEFAAGMHGSADSQQYDQKNIRRRVYDALNVLMAMNIISKEKKEIRWLGLPTNSIQECTTLEKGKQLVIDRIQKKNEQLRELILQHISFKSLIERNRDAENKGVKPSPSSAIHLPFIVVNTSDKALIDCSISNDKTEYMFNFNKRFIIHDDIDILKRMGLLFGLDKGECTEENVERAKSMVPKSLEHFVEQMARGITPSLEDIYQEGEDEDEDELGDDEEEVEVAGEDEQEEVEGEVEAQEYSDDSSDVDV